MPPDANKLTVVENAPGNVDNHRCDRFWRMSQSALVSRDSRRLRFDLASFSAKDALECMAD